MASLKIITEFGHCRGMALEFFGARIKPTYKSLFGEQMERGVGSVSERRNKSLKAVIDWAENALS
jgi:hypothetical protein